MTTTSAPFTALTVPVDASPQSQYAIVTAVAYARGFSTLHFCSVVEPAVDGAVAMGALIDVQPLIQARQSIAQQLSDAAVTIARSKGVPADGSVLTGTTAEAVAGFAASSASDAILICTHARSGLSRFAVGSVTEDLLARSTVPVIVVHANDAVARTGPLTLAFDGTPGAEAARRTAQQIAGALDLTIDTVRIDGDRDIAGAIIARAEAAGSRAIVMGTAGRSGLSRVALGSVAAGVIERATLPVVVVRA